MDPRVKRGVIAAIAVFVLSCAGAIGWAIYENLKNPFPNYIEIANLEEFTTGRPTDRRTTLFVRFALFNAINLNVDRQLENGEIKDVVVRADTFAQTYNEATRVHRVNFIVDSESLQQSYEVNYEWGSGGSVENLISSGMVVYCLPVEKLIYGDFDCSDAMNEEGQVVDPILRYLPYSTLNFEITASGFSDVKTTLNVRITTSAVDERTDSEAAIEKYKNQVMEWVRSVGFATDDYRFDYEIIRASLF
jgi:hypothetical protein